MSRQAEVVFWSFFFTLIVLVVPVALVPAVLFYRYGLIKNWVCGVVLLPMAMIFFLVHFPIVLIFRFHKEFCKNRAFKIMSILGALECFQLFIQMYDGFKLFLWPPTLFGPMADAMYRVLLSSCWDATININFILAYNRFATIVLDSYPVFNSPIIYHILFALTALASITTCVLYVIVMVPMYQGRQPPLDPNFVTYFELIINWTGYGATALCYVAIIIFMIVKIRKDVKIKKEWSLTIQAFIFSVFFAFGTTVFDVLPEGLLHQYLQYYGSKAVWLIVDVSNAVIYLSFNKRLREAYINFWRTASFVDEPKRSSILVSNPSSM